MTITLIVAHDEDYGIGLKNELLWSIPEDLKFFRETTTGNCVLMGRNTYESIGKALPKRLNFIISRNENCIRYEDKRNGNCFWLDSLDKDKLKIIEKIFGDLYIIGGADIYRQVLEMEVVDYVLATEVKGKHLADTYLPFYKDKYTKKTKIVPLTKSVSGKEFEINLYSRGDK